MSDVRNPSTKYDPNVQIRVGDPSKIPSVPLYNRGVNITISDVQSHRRLCSFFKQYWRHNRHSLNFPCYTDVILSFVPQLCFVPCFLLAYTCCRVGELKQIKMYSIRNLKRIKIKSSKSKHVRYVPAFVDFRPEQRLSINPKTMLMVVSYDNLKHSIVQAKKRGNCPSLKSALDVTHVFRHYEATRLFKKGVDISVISNRLGHLDKNTTLCYIH
ncbi:hypothetical protein ES708_19223 [subsurface metagenome]